MQSFRWDMRALSSADTLAVSALYDRAVSAEAGLGPVAAADWERFVAMPQNLAGRDFRTAWSQETLVGLAESSPRQRPSGTARFFKIVVDPAWRRCGLGGALMRELLALDDEAKTEFQTLVRPDWSAGLAFLARLGFTAVEEEIDMRLGAPPAVARRADSKISFARVDDLAKAAEALARIHNAAYRGDASFRAHSGEEMARLASDADVWSAREGGEIIGFCMSEPEAASLWIESLAIDPACQGQGIGAALLRHVLVAERVASDRPARLQVSSLQGVARRLYAELGFVETGRRVRFSAPRDAIRARLR